jgi:hypothetical protein
MSAAENKAVVRRYLDETAVSLWLRFCTNTRDEGDNRMMAHHNTTTTEGLHGSQPLLYQHGPVSKSLELCGCCLSR